MKKYYLEYINYHFITKFQSFFAFCRLKFPVEVFKFMWCIGIKKRNGQWDSVLAFGLAFPILRIIE